MELYLFKSFMQKRPHGTHLRKAVHFSQTLAGSSDIGALTHHLNWQYQNSADGFFYGVQSYAEKPVLESMTAVIDGCFKEEHFQYHITFERLGKVFFDQTYITQHPWSFMGVDTPYDRIEDERYMKIAAYKNPFRLECKKDIVRYSDDLGQGYLLGLPEVPLRISSLEESWRWNLASKFVNEKEKTLLADEWTVSQNLTTGYLNLIKKFSWNLKQCFAVSSRQEDSQDIRNTYVEQICVCLAHIRFFVRNTMLIPLSEERGRFKLIQGGFDEAEKAVLRVSVQFVESLVHLTKLDFGFLRQVLGEADRFSPKVYKSIMMKTLNTEDNISKVQKHCLPFVDQYLKKQSDPAVNTKEDAANGRVWTFDLRCMWLFLRFHEKFISARIGGKSIRYQFDPNSGRLLQQPDDGLVEVRSRDRVAICVNRKDRILGIFEQTGEARDCLEHMKFQQLQTPITADHQQAFFTRVDQETERIRFGCLQLDESIDSRKLECVDLQFVQSSDVSCIQRFEESLYVGCVDLKQMSFRIEVFSIVENSKGQVGLVSLCSFLPEDYFVQLQKLQSNDTGLFMLEEKNSMSTIASTFLPTAKGILMTGKKIQQQSHDLDIELAMVSYQRDSRRLKSYSTCYIKDLGGQKDKCARRMLPFEHRGVPLVIYLSQQLAQPVKVCTFLKSRFVVTEMSGMYGAISRHIALRRKHLEALEFIYRHKSLQLVTVSKTLTAELLTIHINL